MDEGVSDDLIYCINITSRNRMQDLRSGCVQLVSS